MTGQRGASYLRSFHKYSLLHKNLKPRNLIFNGRLNVGGIFENAAVSNTPQTFEEFTRWLGMDDDVLLNQGCIKDNKTQPNRRGTGNLSCVLIHLEAEGPLKLPFFLAHQKKAIDASFHNANVFGSLSGVHSMHWC